MPDEVAPPAGAWIETGPGRRSIPRVPQVAPPAGAWIETLPALSRASVSICRAPRGRVD